MESRLRALDFGAFWSVVERRGFNLTVSTGKGLSVYVGRYIVNSSEAFVVPRARGGAIAMRGEPGLTRRVACHKCAGTKLTPLSNSEDAAKPYTA